MSFETYYEYPLPYETDDIAITQAPVVAPDVWKCPRCDGLLLKEDVDKCCYNCGYRYPFYNDLRLIWWIQDRIRVEERIGEPVLRTNAEEARKACKDRYDQEHKEEIRMRKAHYQATHRELYNERTRKWRMKQREALAMA